MCEHPFRWVQVRNFLRDQDVRRLAREYPTEHFSASVSREGHYRLWDRSVIDHGDFVGPLSDLTPIWRELLDTLVSEEYRQAIVNLTGADLDSCLLKVRLCRYGPGNWMLPHTDKPSRVVTQIIYLTEHWDPSWGGSLQILNSPAPEDKVTELAPEFNSTAMFVRSDTSWHAVTAVSPSATDTRRTVLVQFVRDPE